MHRTGSTLVRTLRGALAGFVVGFVVGLLVHVVDDAAVNPFFFGSIGIAVGAGLAGDRPRQENDRPVDAP
ncbi:hypothetical protein ACI8AG_10360 [Blastococcus sp. SYSU DS0552]